ncbi:hypothetical protein Q4Q35_13855 [Flavivirga aquimarina]|uniref:Uncharacterized protein n=1 Tax=Flavivirga aquimarina TaxID=2027862 RepID=A0ABT8WCL7_9FLAO|nr:hypothetical protein [Flavivirga aquimarina]MDO5970892.1 hypothetical protein [Flavivirga aquimarina]
MAIAETEMKKESLIKILDSFYCKDYEIEKIVFGENKYDYYYEVTIEYSNLSKMKVQRFTESLIAFCLFWNISIDEY